MVRSIAPGTSRCGAPIIYNISYAERQGSRSAHFVRCSVQPIVLRFFGPKLIYFSLLCLHFCLSGGDLSEDGRTAEVVLWCGDADAVVVLRPG